MAATASPYGMWPVQLLGQGPFQGGGMQFFNMTSNSTAAIYKGSPVTINAGECTALTATPTTTRSTNTPVGVAFEFQATPPAASAIAPPLFNYLPASAITGGYTNVMIGVVTSPTAVFKIQADGAVTAASIGLNAEIQTFSGSTVSGLSALTLKSSTIANTATLAVKIVDLVRDANSTPGDAFTDCLVMWNTAVHAFNNSTGG